MKKRLLILLLAAAISAGFTGCGKDSVSSRGSGSATEVITSSKTDISSNTENTEPPTEATGKFDWDTAMDNFYINDMKIEVPFSMNSLGDEYEISYGPYYNNAGSYVSLMIERDGVFVCDGNIHGITLDEFTNDTIIDTIGPTESRFRIQGIIPGTKIEQVYELWGMPDSNRGDNEDVLITD